MGFVDHLAELGKGYEQEIQRRVHELEMHTRMSEDGSPHATPTYVIEGPSLTFRIYVKYLFENRTPQDTIPEDVYRALLD